MSKSSVIILIIAAVVFTGLGFVVGQVMAEGENPGSEDDPVVSQSYVDTAVGRAATELQEDIDEIKDMLQLADSSDTTTDETPNTPDDTPVSGKTVSVTGNSVNIRTSPTTGEVVTAVSAGTVLSYIGQKSSSDGIWYNVKTSGETEGWIRSDLCTSPK